MFQLASDQVKDWNEFLTEFPDAHILQTLQWAEAKKQNGWEPLFLWSGKSRHDLDALCVVLRRQVSVLGLKFTVLYVPKGPTLDWASQPIVTDTLNFLQALSRTQKAIFIKIDPDVLLGTGIPGTQEEQPNENGLAVQKELKKRGWKFSQDQIQYRNTVLIELRQGEEELLAAMKQKTRYNIRLADRKGVTIREGRMEELPMLYDMYAQTAVRDGFVIRHEEYYLNTWRAFLEADMAKILIAEVESQPVAALILLLFNGTSRYMYGMSTEKYRELMPNYLLQWEAIRLSKQMGCHTYDMWGAPDVFDESDSMWGVYRFKQGFNGITARHLGAWDYSPRPLLYKAYTQALPKLLDLMRRRGKSENLKQVQND
ncbi:MAG: peptidoglycan bridge formation glycyltransferase FemA/FemB family protein [Anaerolineaceae bacterium]|nr:peptidoglycan bridge formation glycyltransferase FemA/FemB family protein [Anaerolineaceae bacterium]MDD4042724.1 peptidoglycan bridge formation glycyltransferase FemA/FemB family protein [Anaerolineaceae bacterium]MDD4577067.1 peptidoglycan bridge formation glycyltransferase FemA/FemB family protein [Anaerolineaceae bacterium]